MTILIYSDQDGLPYIQAPPEFQLVGVYFEHDVQYGPYTAKYLIDRVDEIVAGKFPHSTVTGNAFSLELTASTARIESLFDESLPAVELPLVGFRALLVEWSGILKARDK